jgi:crotonobetaine/carnitine-CoA ligase
VQAADRGALQKAREAGSGGNEPDIVNLRNLLETRIDKDAERPFVFFRDQIIDFLTLDKNVNRASNAFLKIGVTKGDTVCIFLANCLEFLYLWFGLAKIGAVMVPLNTGHRGEELQHIIHHSDAKWIIVDEPFYPAYAAIEDGLTHITHQIWHSEAAPPPKGFTSLSNLMEEATDVAPPVQDVKSEDPLGILYTSSTPSTFRGIAISHFNYINTGHTWAHDVIHCTEGDIFLTTLPLFHANAQMFTVMGSLCSGSPFVLKERFSAPHFLNEARQSRATIFNHTEEMLHSLLKHTKRESDLGSRPRAAFGGALSPEVRREVERRYHLTCIEGYGQLESGGLCLFTTDGDHKPGSIGKPTAFCQLAIWDHSNQEVPRGETGEIVVKELVPHTLFLGYYKQPDKTAEALEGGAFHTGDAGYEDEDGNFYLVGRTKAYNRRHGETIFCHSL